MPLKRGAGFYFSPTHTTQKVVRAVLEGAGLPQAEWDVTLPESRRSAVGAPPAFDEETLAVLAAPVYGGRLPPAFAKALSCLQGNGAPAILLVQFGNRHYDEALRQLYDLAVEAGFLPLAAGAFVGEHSFTGEIASGRPDADDLGRAAGFGKAVMEKWARLGRRGALPRQRVPFRPVDVAAIGSHRENMKKMGASGLTVDRSCMNCGRCAAACPVQALFMEEGRLNIRGERCIKCRACARVCPKGAIDLRHPLFAETVADAMEKFGRLHSENVTAL